MIFCYRRTTNKIVLRKEEGSPLVYHCGDHVGIMAVNRPDMVDFILKRLKNLPADVDEHVEIQLLQEKHTPMGNVFFRLFW